MIRNIALYFVKGAAGMEVSFARLTPEGLKYGNYADHQFMVVGAEPGPDSGTHPFVTQRWWKKDAPGRKEMALIKPRMKGYVLELTWDYKNPIEVPHDMNSGVELPVKIWDDKTYAVDQGGGLAEWLSDNLQTNVRLVKAAGSFNRKARQNYMSNYNNLYFQDAYPVHWLSIESVTELSEKAGVEIPWQSFRPQIVVEGMGAQYEHNIEFGRIGRTTFMNPKPCDRCNVTLVDQETGMIREKSSKDGKDVAEPLYTLNTYKVWKNNDGELVRIFGENMLPNGESEIQFGSEFVPLMSRRRELVYGSMEEIRNRT